MATITASISIDDTPAPDLLVSLLEMEVEEDHDLASIFRIRLAIRLQDDGTWTLLDDDRMQLWKKVAIKTNVADSEVSLVEGFLTQMSAHIDPDENNSYLELKGMDATCLMNLEEKVKDWPDQSDSDIATQILSSYNLTAQVDDSGVIHDETVSTTIQRDTDIQFLKKLARRNGFECVVRGGTGFFQKPPLSAAPQPVLAAYFGPNTNLYSFEARATALRPAQVEMHQIDTIGKQAVDVAVAASDQSQLGRDGAASLTPPNGVTSKIIVRHALTTGQQEMQTLSQAVFDEAEWLIQASGEIDSVIYGGVLQSRTLVPIKGVGEMFSGVYYVTNVKHVFDVEHYIQRFKARRNALAPKPGDFGGGLPF